MPTRRLLIDTLVAALLAVVLVAVGWLSADPLLHLATRALGADELLFTGPGDLLWYRVSIALAFALPAPAAWLAVLLERALTKDVPSWTSFALYGLLPSAGVFIAIGTRLRDLALVGEQDPALLLQPMVTIGTIDFGSRGLELAATFSAVMWIAVAFVASRRARLERNA